VFQFQPSSKFIQALKKFFDLGNEIILQKHSMKKKMKREYSVRDLFVSKPMIVRTIVMGYLW